MPGLGCSTQDRTRDGKEGKVGHPERGRASLLGTEGDDRSAFIFLQPGVPRPWVLSRMSLNAWEREDEDPVSMGPLSSMASFYQSGSECDVEEYLKVKAQAQESDSEHPCSSESSFGLASTLDSDVPQAVPCKFIISLAFPVSTGKCWSRIPTPSAKRGAPMTFPQKSGAPELPPLASPSEVSNANSRSQEGNCNFRDLLWARPVDD